MGIGLIQNPFPQPRQLGRSRPWMHLVRFTSQLFQSMGRSSISSQFCFPIKIGIFFGPVRLIVMLINDKVWNPGVFKAFCNDSNLRKNHGQKIEFSEKQIGFLGVFRSMPVSTRLLQFKRHWVLWEKIKINC